MTVTISNVVYILSLLTNSGLVFHWTQYDVGRKMLMVNVTQIKHPAIEKEPRNLYTQEYTLMLGAAIHRELRAKQTPVPLTFYRK